MRRSTLQYKMARIFAKTGISDEANAEEGLIANYTVNIDLEALKQEVVNVLYDKIKKDISVLKGDIKQNRGLIVGIQEDARKDISELRADVEILKGDLFIFRQNILNLKNEIKDSYSELQQKQIKPAVSVKAQGDGRNGSADKPKDAKRSPVKQVKGKIVAKKKTKKV